MSPDPTTDEAIEIAAAEWLVQHDRGLTPAEREEFERWRRADPRHAAHFQALAGSWELVSDARHAPSLLAEQAEREAVRQSEAVPPRRRHGWRYAAAGLAAAAALVFASLVGLREFRLRACDETYTTQIGGVEKLDLPDGSVLTLNTDSAVAVHFVRGERRVALERGEAHFAVAKDKTRPFIVSANGVDVRAVGTAFSVRLRAEAVDVLVTEGKVSVAPPEPAPDATAVAAPATLSPTPSVQYVTAGQRTSISLKPAAEPAAIVAVAPEAVKQALAWQERRLDFEAATLGDIAADMNRYSPLKLVIADPALAAKRFGGSFPAGDVDTLVRQLQRNFSVTVERKGDDLVLRLPEAAGISKP